MVAFDSLFEFVRPKIQHCFEQPNPRVRAPSLESVGSVEYINRRIRRFLLLLSIKYKMTLLTTSIQVTKHTKYKLNNGQQIPIAGYGVYDIPRKETKALVYRALKDGYRHVDTAEGYGNQGEAASAIADFLKDHPEVSRRDIWFTTKISDKNHGYETTKKAVEKIANEVKQYVDYVDLILIHSPLADKESRLGTWKALQEHVIDPTHPVLSVKSIGVSNYEVNAINEILQWEGFIVKPVINQLELHPWLPRVELRNFLIANDIAVEAYSPLTQGVKLNDPELCALEKKTGISKIKLLLTWSFLQGFIVLAKTAHPDRIKQNLDVLPDGDDENDHGKLDLDPDVLQVFDKPDSVEILTWGGRDLTLL
jgi:diketogulonate reductase-like aldo/keto reductase